MKTILIAAMSSWLTASAVGAIAEAQTTDDAAGARIPPPSQSSASAVRSWHVEFTLMNAFDGNINHDPEPVRSYGVASGMSLRYERPGIFSAGSNRLFAIGRPSSRASATGRPDS